MLDWLPAISLAAQFGPAQIIGQNEHDLGRSLYSGRNVSKSRENTKKQEENYAHRVISSALSSPLASGYALGR